MKTFPVMLDVRGRQAVVVGGGPVGRRKVRALLRAGAKVRLVSAGAAPKGLPEGVAVVRQRYRSALLKGARLVFACTDDRAVNARIASDARAAGALVNAADQPEDCDFHLPATLSRGDVVIAIGTGGAAPALAASLKRRLAAALPPGTGRFAALLAVLRRELKAAVPDARRRMGILRRLAGSDVLEEFLGGGEPAVRARLLELTRPARAKRPGRRRPGPRPNG